MIFLNYDDPIHQNSTENLMSQVNDLINSAKMNDSIMLGMVTPEQVIKPLLTIYYSTDGGSMFYSTVQTKLLNTLASYYDITLITGEVIMSAGIDVIMNFKGNVVLTEETIFMIHQPSVLTEARENHNKKSIARVSLNSLESYRTKGEKELLPFLTKEQQKDYVNGIDIYLTKKEFEIIFNKIKAKKKVVKKAKVVENTTKVPVKKTVKKANKRIVK